MDELELLLIRLEDISESAENKDVRVLAKALKRYLAANKTEPMGFKCKEKEQ